MMSYFGDPDDADDPSKLPIGQCCNCLRVEALRNVMMLHRRGPSPGNGWGCVQCKLPADGAVALVCDDCVEIISQMVEPRPRYVCTGYATEPDRTLYDDLSPEHFDHDYSRHPEHDAHGGDPC